MTDFEVLKRDLLAECEDDHVGLWAVIGYVEDEMPRASPIRIRQETLKLLQELLEADQIQAGFPDSNGTNFHSWPFPAKVIVEWIESQWKTIGPQPKPGEIVWFTTPSSASVRV